MTDTHTKIINSLDLEFIVKDFWDSLALANNVKNNRQRRNVIYKHSFFVSCRELTTLSLSSIGKVMGKDHATVLHACRKHEINFMYDSTYRAIYDQVYESLKQKMDEFNVNLNELVTKRINRMEVESFNSAMLIVYKNKLEKQQSIFELEISNLKKEREILRKQLKSSRAREESLNKECLRLKNLV